MAYRIAEKTAAKRNILRLRRVKDIGVCPMAMLYRDMSGSIIQPERDWKRLQRLWARPALIYGRKGV
jgi:hypothetical protein